LMEQKTRVYDIAAKTMVLADDPKFTETKAKTDKYVMLSTGLTDTNKTELYEGDVVTYEQENYSVHLKGKEYVLSDGYNGFLIPDWSQVEVIGCILDYQVDR